MRRESVDVLVMGAGFAGSLTALLLQRIGRRVALVDRGQHPRFAIGESSTPLADLILRSLATRYDLPELLPLCSYGTWKASCPEVTCGAKRGFSYFLHHPNRPFTVETHHGTELLVAASRALETADTHWLRADVDHYFCRAAECAGVAVFQQTDLKMTRRSPWGWEGLAAGKPLAIDARLVIDASGPAGVVPRALGISPATESLRTRSRAIFGHCRDVKPWSDLLQQSGIDTADYPFRADVAALHHLTDEGWMWQLPFDNGVTSVGIVVDGMSRAASDGAGADASQLWATFINRYPSIAAQFEHATIIAPAATPVSSPRLQRMWSCRAGADWALLPATAGFIDPLHSTGIAHALSGVERLVRIVESAGAASVLADELREYDRQLERELRLIDVLVAAGYATRRNFPLFVAATMLYFVAAITCEERRLAGGSPGFLATDDRVLYETLMGCAKRLVDAAALPADPQPTLISEIRSAIAPWNSVRLFDPDVPNMYHYTGR